MKYGKSLLVCAICAMAAQAGAAPTDNLKQRMARVGIGVAAPSVMSDSFAAGAVLASASTLKAAPRRPEMLVTSFRSDTTTGTANSFVRLASAEPADLDTGSAGRVAALSTLDSSSVSEPHAAMLLALGLVGLVLLSRRRPSDHD